MNEMLARIGSFLFRGSLISCYTEAFAGMWLILPAQRARQSWQSQLRHAASSLHQRGHCRPDRLRLAPSIHIQTIRPRQVRLEEILRPLRQPFYLLIIGIQRHDPQNNGLKITGLQLAHTSQMIIDGPRGETAVLEHAALVGRRRAVVEEHLLHVEDGGEGVVDERVFAEELEPGLSGEEGGLHDDFEDCRVLSA